MRNIFLLAFAASFGFASAQSWFEGFEDIGGVTTNGQNAGANLEAQGWFFDNKSTTRGISDWFQGNLGVFGPHEGQGYIGANFQNTTGVGTISNWMLTPVRNLQNGDTLSFWTRSTDGHVFPDRLQIRMSTAGSSTNVGAGPNDVGDFTELLLDINPTYGTDYPDVWTQFTVTVAGLGAPVDGRFAFRYFVENAGPNGSNSDYIGIDAAEYTVVPEPATLAALGLGAAALLRRRKKA